MIVAHEEESPQQETVHREELLHQEALAIHQEAMEKEKLALAGEPI